MKKIILTIIFASILSGAFAQWEFRYFVLKVGATHQMMSPSPKAINNLFLNTQYGEMRLTPDTTFFVDYVPGFNVALHFHFDFSNDKGGIVIGAEYQNFGISSKYKSVYGDYSLIQTHRLNSIGIPIYLKFGNEIFNRQNYFFAGLKYNFNLAVRTTDVVNWSIEHKSKWLNDNEFVSNNLTFFVGFNYMIFNVQLDFMPTTFLNKEYTLNLNGSVKPYSTQPDKLFFLETSITVPLSKWTTSKSYFINRMVRKFK